MLKLLARLWGSLKPPPCKGIHYKKCGEKHPGNMREVIRIDLEWERSCAVYECSHCGTRAFSHSSYFIVSTRHLEEIQKFIEHKMSLEDLQAYLTRNKITWVT